MSIAADLANRILVPKPMGAASLSLKRPQRIGAQENTSGTFDVMGRAVQTLETGHLYIRRNENGTSKKVFISE